MLPVRQVGKVLLRDGVTVPKSVAIVHCVGSRDKNYHNYCSAICCMQIAQICSPGKEKTGAEVYNFISICVHRLKPTMSFTNASFMRA